MVRVRVCPDGASHHAPTNASGVAGGGVVVIGEEATVVEREWLRSQIEAEPWWFLKQDLGDGLVTPGWSDPRHEKLPHFGLPEDMSDMRVLDIGCNEGFFSFEAE